MKKFSLILSLITVTLFVASCENEDLENETYEIRTIDKENVRPPGGTAENSGN